MTRSRPSQLEVKFESELQLANPKLNFLPSKIASQAVQLDGRPVQHSFGGVTAWGENMGRDGALQPFRLERKYGTQFAENIYFSAATLRTQEHVAILREIETVLK